MLSRILKSLATYHVVVFFCLQSLPYHTCYALGGFLWGMVSFQGLLATIVAHQPMETCTSLKSCITMIVSTNIWHTGEYQRILRISNLWILALFQPCCLLVRHHLRFLHPSVLMSHVTALMLFMRGRPYGAAMLLATYDEAGPQLAMIEPSGNAYVSLLYKPRILTEGNKADQEGDMLQVGEV